MATFDGYTVLAGVKWEVDKDTITIKCYPSKRGYKYQLYKKTWKNYCPFCKKNGILRGSGFGKGKSAKEGEITCKKCDADFCGVSGKDKANIVRKTLTKASSKKSTTAVKTESKTNDKKTSLAELKKDYNEKNKPKKDFKLTIPPLKNIREGTYIELNPPLVEKSKIFFIGSVDFAEDDMQLTLYENVPEPGTTYSESNNTTKSTNPSPTTNSVKVSGAKSAIEKTIMLKGAELKTINKIYNWLRKDGGDGGFRYVLYLNHIKKEDAYKFGVNSAKYCWKTKKANCVDFAWIFYTMCKGAGIKVNIIQGRGVFPDKIWDHFWNKYNGKIYDCSASSCSKYTQNKVVI